MTRRRRGGKEKKEEKKEAEKEGEKGKELEEKGRRWK